MLANGRWDLIRRLKGQYDYGYQMADTRCRSVAGITGSIPAGGMDICLLSCVGR